MYLLHDLRSTIEGSAEHPLVQQVKSLARKDRRLTLFQSKLPCGRQRIPSVYSRFTLTIQVNDSRTFHIRQS